MKVVVITIIILIIFFAGSIWLSEYISQSTQKLVEQIEQLDEAIEEENWNEAQNNLNELSKEWEKTKKGWLIFLEHYEIDSIDIVLAKVGRYAALEERETALGELAHLKTLVEHVKEKSRLHITNIL
ncbi:conserved hypothetical protein [Alkaliphilus metalliredigens QYMF]|uniref:DUF4363 domain-containing protein n=1 Tax=Alkaliphilus metalliredigens (strain QYMF) TaxID=293826 RepID=A6TW39_ALKMQ|nr:DUF4363 family protein [Alkaliphilus metalliredigens]ABR50407.1 conserved hypothetical protein [Alkaliphilus metalliredigens QYMF]